MARRRLTIPTGAGPWPPQLMEAIAQVIAQCDLRPPQPGEYADRLTLQPTTDPRVAKARKRARKAKQG